jgi:(p)ppGpp synthase/HD superfamily hydrolase
VASQPSKEAVNRAGALIAELMAAYNAGDVEEQERLEADDDPLDDAVALIDWWRSLHAKPLTSLSANLRYYLKPHGPVVVTQRLKRAPTMIDKLLREPTMKLTQMADIGGCRALLQDQAAVYEIARRLRRNWEVERTRDYAAEPKDSGYRAVHLIVKRRGRLIEVQLRTPLQDAWANQVEEDSRRVGRNFKGGEGQQEVHNYYAVVSELLALRELGEEPDNELRRRLLAAYKATQAYLVTNKGGKR